MHCYVYKGDKYDHYYLYLSCEIATAQVPEALLSMLGELNLVIDFELNSERQLPQADSRQVLQDIQNQGFYLQMPKEDLRADLSADLRQYFS